MFTLLFDLITAIMLVIMIMYTSINKYMYMAGTENDYKLQLYYYYKNDWNECNLFIIFGANRMLFCTSIKL